MANPAKLKAAVAYLAGQTSPGKTKLFKLLYFADFTAYAEHGVSISGTSYHHYVRGPVPAALRHDLDTYAKVTVLDLDSEQSLPMQLISGKDDADLSILSQTDRDILDRILA